MNLDSLKLDSLKLDSLKLDSLKLDSLNLVIIQSNEFPHLLLIFPYQIPHLVHHIYSNIILPNFAFPVTYVSNAVGSRHTFETEVSKKQHKLYRNSNTGAALLKQ